MAGEKAFFTGQCFISGVWALRRSFYDDGSCQNLKRPNERRNWTRTLFYFLNRSRCESGTLHQSTVMPHNPANLNIGEIIKNKVDLSRWNYTEFAREINCSRSSLYNMFNSRDISLLRLLKICDVLGENILDEILCQNNCEKHASSFLNIAIRDGHLMLSDLPVEILRLLEKHLLESSEKQS